MARPRTPAKTPPAPPLVTKDHLPPDDTFRLYRKTELTRIAGPFEPPVEIETVQGVIVVETATYLALDSEGHPYPVAPDVLAATYQPADADGDSHDENVRLKQAFDDGVAEGLRRAAEKTLPLFEQAKRLARDSAVAGEPEARLREALADLEAERGEQLSRADRDLVVAQHRRLRAHQAQRDEAAREPGRPRRPAPEPAKPKPTEYEHVT